MASKETADISHVETPPDFGPRYTCFTEEEAAFLANFPEERRRKVLRKIDVRLVPFLALLYLVSYIDRANIGNANIEGLSADLGLDNRQYSVALCVFFASYVFFEIPSNLVLKKVKPSIWISILAISWAIVMTLTGVVQSWGGLVACRFFLGVTEAGFFPGAVLIVSSWYAANEIQKRIALFYCASALAGGFSGLLAYAIAKMDGIGGYEGWRWIFIIEGLASLVVGIACPFVLINDPQSSKWLDDEEKRFVILRMQIQDSGTEIQKRGSHVSWKVMKSVLLDEKLYFLAITYFCNVAGNFGLTFTMPQIIKNMGYTSSHAQLLTVPPYVAGAISALIAARYADHFTWRMPFIAGPFTLVIIGFTILYKFSTDHSKVGLCYFSLVLTCIGFFPITPGLNSWAANNLSGPVKRAAGLGFMMSIGNSGGVVGSFIYVKSEAPSYPTGFGTTFGLAATGIASVLILEGLLLLKNKRKARLSPEAVKARYTDEQLADMGDKSPLFKYTI